MGSSPVDKSTQQSSSAAATALSATQAANAAAAQQKANSTAQQQFGTYDAATGKYSGGTESQFLDPNSLNQNGLTGTYQNQYNNAANNNANTAANSVGTTIANLNSRGMGATPAGFDADLQRKAYADQAASNSANYSNLSQSQLTNALSNYWNANNALSAYGTNQQNAALTGNANANSTNTSLYGTASQQKQNPVAGIIGAAAGAGATAFAGR